jgi:hypothetical protein
MKSLESQKLQVISVLIIKYHQNILKAILDTEDTQYQLNLKLKQAMIIILTGMQGKFVEVQSI